MDMSIVLPEECISLIISLTSPRDACRLSLVSPVLKLAADSDAVWETFLPSDYQQIVSSSASSSLLSAGLSKKDIFLFLCHNPIFFNDGTMSFAIDKESGKKCIMVGAKGLTIVWGTTPRYWKWPCLRSSRFGQVANLIHVWWLEVKGMIEAKMLSSKTTYVAYFIFNLSNHVTGLEGPAKSGVYFEGRNDGERRSVYLNRRGNIRGRRDGWMEIEMGEFFNDDGKLVYSLLDDSPRLKEGLIIEGIEFRPKDDIYR